MANIRPPITDLAPTQGTGTARIVTATILCVMAILVSLPALAMECWIWIISSGYVASRTPGSDFLFTPNSYPLLFWSGPLLFTAGFLACPPGKSKMVIGFLGLIPFAQTLFNLYFIYLEKAI